MGLFNASMNTAIAVPFQPINKGKFGTLTMASERARLCYYIPLALTYFNNAKRTMEEN